METTGPYMLTRAYERSAHRGSLFLAPAESVYPLDEPACRTGEGYDLRVWCERTANAYAVHHWSGSWLKEMGTQEAFQRTYPVGLPVTCFGEGRNDGEAGLIHHGLLNEGPTVLCVVPPHANVDDLRNAIACFRNQTYRSSKFVIAMQRGAGVADALKGVTDPRVQTIEFPEAIPSLWEGLQAIACAIPAEFIAVWRATDLSEPQRLSLAMTAALATQAGLVWFKQSLIWLPESDLLGLSEASFDLGTALISRRALTEMSMSTRFGARLGVKGSAVELDAPNAICQLYTSVDRAPMDRIAWRVPSSSYSTAVACLVNTLKLAT